MDATSFLGMGIAIQLRNMFSAPASAVVNSSRSLTAAITADQAKTINGWKLLGGGASMMFLGTGMLAFLGKVGQMSLKSSSDLEVFRLQIRLLAKDSAVGDNLFAGLKQFSTTTPFTIPQVMAGARNLMAFGIGASKVINQLKLAGDWASMMSMPIEEAAMILGKVHSGALSYAMRSLQRAGIGYAAIAAAGGPVTMSKNGFRTQPGADPEKFLEAVNRVINQKFAGSMGLIMQTVPGMLTNMKDQMILMGSTIGDVIKPQVKEVLHSILQIFNPALIMPFATAVGSGLAAVLHGALLVLKPIGQVVTWFIALANAHPGVVKLMITMIALGGVILNVAGAALIFLGIWNIISALLASAATSAFIAMLGSMVAPILAIVAAATLLYIAFEHNFMGIATVGMWFYNRFRIITLGVIELFSTLSNGVGYLSQSTVDVLNQYGLLGVVVQLFMLGYRLVSFVKGIGDAFIVAAQSVAFIGSAIMWVLVPVAALVALGLEVARALGFVNAVGFTSSNMFQQMGRVVGALLVGVLAYKAAATLAAVAQAVWTFITGLGDAALSAYIVVLYAWAAATKLMTSAQWLLNIAMDANPVGLVIGGIAILIVLTVLLVQHFKGITAWFHSLSPLTKMLLFALAPMLIIPVMIAKHWQSLKMVFTDLGTLIKNVLGAALDWVSNKIAFIWDKITSLVKWGGKMIGLATPTVTAAGAPIGNAVGQTGLSAQHSALLVAKQANAQVESTLMRVHEELTKLNTHFDKPVPPVPVVLNLDGKQIATTVNKINEGKRASGR